jgi:hypothetical protein
MLAGLSILLLLPFAVYRFAKRVRPNRRWTAAGISFGLIIAPASLGLYGLYFVSSLGFLPGMLGLILTLVHGVPGWEIGSALGLFDSYSVVDWKENMVIDLINGACWAVVYGALGYLIDRWREAKGGPGASSVDALTNAVPE